MSATEGPLCRAVRAKKYSHRLAGCFPHQLPIIQQKVTSERVR